MAQVQAPKQAPNPELLADQLLNIIRGSKTAVDNVHERAKVQAEALLEQYLSQKQSFQAEQATNGNGKKEEVVVAQPPQQAPSVSSRKTK